MHEACAVVVLHIITAGSICTLITLHYAVSFTITNNSFDVKALCRSYCLIFAHLRYMQSILSGVVLISMSTESRSHSLSLALLVLLSQSHCILYILLHGMCWNVFVVCCGCITHKHKLMHAHKTLNDTISSNFNNKTALIHTCMRNTRQ